MLWLALAARNAATRPSEMAGLDEIHGAESPVCLDFDLACALRLQIYDREMRIDSARLIAEEVGKAFAGTSGETSAGAQQQETW